MATFQSHKGFDQQLNVQAHQSAHLPKGLRHEWTKTPTQSAAAWGSTYQVSFSTKNVSLDDIWLEYSMPALSGLTVSNSGTAAYIPSPLWINRLEILIGSLVVASETGLTIYLNNQLFTPTTSKAAAINTAMGAVAHATRATKSASAGYWYVPVHSLFNQASVPLVTNQDVVIRVTMNSLADCYSLTSGETATGTAAGAITSVNLLTRVTHLPQHIANHTLALLRKASLHFPFTETKIQTFAIGSGVSTYNAVLSGIQGYVPYIYFVLRASSPTGANAYTWNATVTQFELLDGGSSSLTGGQPVLADQNRFVMPKWITNTFLQDNDQVFVYAFCADPQAVAESASQLGGFQFKGSEQLKITLSGNLGAAAQLDVIAPTYAALELSLGGARKIALTA
jgi:hypothetical protein